MFYEYEATIVNNNLLQVFSAKMHKSINAISSYYFPSPHNTERL